MSYTNLYNFFNQKGGENDVKFDSKKTMDQILTNKALLLCVMFNFILQLCITYYVFKYNKYYNSLIEKTSRTSNNVKNKKIKDIDTKIIEKYNARFTTILLILIGLILVLCFFNIPSYLKFIIFCLFSYILGIVLIFCKYAVGNNLTETMIKGLLMIIVVFFIIFALLYIIRVKDIKNLLFILYLLLAFVFLTISSMFNLETNITYRVVSFIILFIITVYMIYDTHNIMQREYQKDFVTASLDYFIDIFKLINNWFQKLVFYKEYKK